MKYSSHSLSRVAPWLAIIPVMAFLVILGYIRLTFVLQNYDLFLPRPQRFAFQIFLYMSISFSVIAIVLAGVLFAKGQSRFRMASTACLGIIILFSLFRWLFPILEVAFPARMAIGSWHDVTTDLNDAMRRGDLRLIILTNHLGEEWPGVLPSPSETESFWKKNGLKIIAGEFWPLQDEKDMDDYYINAREYAEEYNTRLLLEIRNRQQSGPAYPPQGVGSADP